MCQQPILPGSCNETHARWGFDTEARACRPFYFTGCGGNLNNFPRLSECQLTCPDTAPPTITVSHTHIRAELGDTVALSVNIRLTFGVQ